MADAAVGAVVGGAEVAGVALREVAARLAVGLAAITSVVDPGLIVLTGGAAQLRGWTERLRHELGIPVRLADDPQHAVIRGAGACVDDFGSLERVLAGPGRR